MVSSTLLCSNDRLPFPFSYIDRLKAMYYYPMIIIVMCPVIIISMQICLLFIVSSVQVSDAADRN